MCELPDQSLAVADLGGVAWRVWPDGTQPPQPLPPATANATCVLPVGGGGGGDGWLVVSYNENRVERTGSIAWRRTDVKQPWAGVVVGDTALVTETNGGGAGKARVVRLALGSGATVGTLGQGTLQYPRGIAVGPDGCIFVADIGTPKVVHVS